jgi:hypothetical protein
VFTLSVLPGTAPDTPFLDPVLEILFGFEPAWVFHELHQLLLVFFLILSALLGQECQEVFLFADHVFFAPHKQVSNPLFAGF